MTCDESYSCYTTRTTRNYRATVLAWKLFTEESKLHHALQRKSAQRHFLLHGLTLLLSYDYVLALLLITTYLLIYNVTSLLLFSTCLQLPNLTLRTLFSFSDLGPSNILTKILSLVLLSLAGVPPFAGFFSKVFLLVLLSHSNLFVLYPPFFTLTLMGLYFYVQNIRFLNSSAATNAAQAVELSSKIRAPYFFVALPIGFATIFGVYYFEDLFILFS